MRCDIHPDHDAVGTCTYCGRGVCEQCKVRMFDKIHCKECVEAGRVRGAPEPQAGPSQGPPGATPSMGYPQYPGYQNVYMAPVLFKQPKPHGTPNKRYFKFGMAASFTCSVTSFIVAILMVSGIFLRVAMNTNYILIVGILVSTFFLYPVLISFFGFYKNYGSSTALLTVIGGVSLLPFYQFLWVYYNYTTLSHSNTETYIDILFFSQIFLGGVLLMATISIRSISFFMVPFSEGRRATTWALATMIVASFAFFSVLGFYIFGWIWLGIGMGCLGNMFMKAPMPDASGAVQMPPGPMTPPPIRAHT